MLAGSVGPEGGGVEVDAQRVALLAALEDLKNAATGLQVCVTAAFDVSQREQQVAAGAVSEFAATLVAQCTACLSLDDRREIDRQLAGDPARMSRLGERGVQAEVARAAARLDPASVVERRRRAERERCVSLRPAPDTMTYLTALLPVAEGVAVYKALNDAAGSARAAGDGRTRGQVMADALVESVLAGAGVATVTPGDADADTTASDVGALDREDLTGAPHGVGVVLNIVMSERQLFGSGQLSEGGALMVGLGAGTGQIDADLARQLAALTAPDRVWLRRLYTDPESGELVAIDSRRRRFPPGLQRLIRFRDQRRRTPYCQAPIRHIDHAHRVADGGETRLRNGQGYCEACNYAKEAPGWSAHSVGSETEGGRHRIQTTTPTGYGYITVRPTRLGRCRPRQPPPGPCRHSSGARRGGR